MKNLQVLNALIVFLGWFPKHIMAVWIPVVLFLTIAFAGFGFAKDYPRLGFSLVGSSMFFMISYCIGGGMKALCKGTWLDWARTQRHFLLNGHLPYDPGI